MKQGQGRHSHYGAISGWLDTNTTQSAQQKNTAKKLTRNCICNRAQYAWKLCLSQLQDIMEQKRFQSVDSNHRPLGYGPSTLPLRHFEQAQLLTTTLSDAGCTWCILIISITRQSAVASLCTSQLFVQVLYEPADSLQTSTERSEQAQAVLPSPPWQRPCSADLSSHNSTVRNVVFS